MKLLVVIVNYKTAKLAIAAATSARPEVEARGGRITIVDNDSGDGSIDALRAAFADVPGVDVIAAERNGGFGYGNNVAIRRALASDDPPTYVYLLNPDATVRPGAIAALMAFMDGHPECGIAGTHIVDPDGGTHVSAFRFPSPLGEVEGTLKLGVVTKLLRRWSVWSLACDRTEQVDWVSGASVALRTTMLRDIGLFDENFFLYFEETDLCRRAAEAGWPVWFVREATVVHEVAAATGIKDTRRRMPPYWFASRRYYFLKQGGWRELWLANMAWLAGFSLWRVRRRLQGRPDVDPPHMLADFVRNNLRPRARPGA